MVEAYDLVNYNSGPLTKLDILDKGCSAAFACRITNNTKRSSSLRVRETRRKNQKHPEGCIEEVRT